MQAFSVHTIYLSPKDSQKLLDYSFYMKLITIECALREREGCCVFYTSILLVSLSAGVLALPGNLLIAFGYLTERSKYLLCYC